MSGRKKGKGDHSFSSRLRIVWCRVAWVPMQSAGDHVNKQKWYPRIHARRCRCRWKEAKEQMS